MWRMPPGYITLVVSQFNLAVFVVQFCHFVLRCRSVLQDLNQNGSPRCKSEGWRLKFYKIPFQIQQMLSPWHRFTGGMGSFCEGAPTLAKMESAVLAVFEEVFFCFSVSAKTRNSKKFGVCFAYIFIFHLTVRALSLVTCFVVFLTNHSTRQNDFTWDWL